MARQRQRAEETADADVTEDAGTDVWMHEDELEGQLAVDVFQTPTDIIIRSAIAGVAPEDVKVAVNRDVVTIRGKRAKHEHVQEGDYLFQECYWGGFSRSIILPVEVQTDKVRADLKNGILTVTLPKAASSGAREVMVESSDD